MTNYQYQIGGTLEINHCTYIKRKADDHLYKCLKKGDFCYIFNTRQMGKSSLQAQVQNQLIQDGFICVYLTLEDIGSNITETDWYYSLLDLLISSLDLDEDFDLESWWKKHQSLTDNIRKFSKFIEEVLLKLIEGKLIIFIDEIDGILSLNFPIDKFFAVIRACYNKRATNKLYQKLSFCLIGVVTPDNLIKDFEKSPFNIGEAIKLTYFKIEETKNLAKGLENKVKNPEKILKIILKYTGGQPFLTQRICDLVLQSNKNINQLRNIDKFIKNLIELQVIANWKYDDPQSHFLTIEQRLLKSKNARFLLRLYYQILQNKKIKFIKDNLFVNELLLTGLVKKEDNLLKIINPIYQKIFNLQWVERELIKIEGKPKLTKIITINLMLIIIINMIILGLRSLGLLQIWELQIYDLMMTLKLDRGQDQRLLIIEITEKDLKYQDKKGMMRQYSLADQALNQLLDKIEPLQPKLIGLDVIRDFPVNQKYPQLAQKLAQQNNLFAICVGDEPNNNKIGIAPPPEIPKDRLGFSDLIPDQGNIIRRYLWYANFSEKSPCQTNLSFALQITLAYLKTKGIEPEITREGYPKLGQVTLKRLNNPAGGYQNFDNSGYQILLNYRTKKDITQRLTLEEILENKFDPNLIKNRIILISITAESVKQEFFTPFGTKPNQKILGIMIHAQMISQLLDAVLDTQPLLFPASQGVEMLWIFSWSIIATVIVWRWQNLTLIVIKGVIIIILIVINWLFFLNGLWLPLLPSILTFVMTGGTLIVYKISFNSY
jgi:CHASE2 domain-containing sensor protein